MAVKYRSQGLVLKIEPQKEADQLFTLYTKDFGKIKILGRAIRKITSKLRPGLDLFYLSQIEFIQGRFYKTLTDAVVIEDFRYLGKSIERFETASRISSSFNSLVTGEEQDKEAWALLKDVFEKLNSRSFPAGHSFLIYYYFLWNLLSILGYSIDLYHCVVCRKRLDTQSLYFNPEQGGIICSHCLKEKPGQANPIISPDIIKILRLFQEKNWPLLSKLKITDSHKKSLETISNYYLQKIK